MLSRQTSVVLDTLLPGVLEAGFDEFYADFRQTAAFPLRLGFRTAVWTAAWLAPTLIGRLPPISRYDRDEREKALAALASSRIYLLRQMVLILKAVACFCYGADAKARTSIGHS